MKVAILGGSYHQPGSRHFKMAMNLAETLASKGHQLISAGGSGISLATAQGVRKAGGECKIFTDLSDSGNFFLPEASEDEFFHNLRSIVRKPDVHVFFAGRQGTALQLMTMLHLLSKPGDIFGQQARIIIYSDRDSHALSSLMANFHSLVGEGFPPAVNLAASYDQLLELILGEEAKSA